MSMYNKEALTALINKVKAEPDEAQSSNDMHVIREACMNACSYIDAVRKCALVMRFDGRDSESYQSAKEVHTGILRRLLYNMAAMNALSGFYAADNVFAGSVESVSDVEEFCAEFTASLTKTKSRQSESN